MRRSEILSIRPFVDLDKAVICLPTSKQVQDKSPYLPKQSILLRNWIAVRHDSAHRSGLETEG